MNQLFNFALFLTLVFSSQIYAKITIFAHYFGQPEFVKYQYLFFKKNLKDDFEFVVVEDSNNPEISKKIQKECLKYNIRYIHIPKIVFEKPSLPVCDSSVNLNDPSFQCSVATQYIYDNLVLQTHNPCLIIDNDIFLISSFSIEDYLGDYQFAYPKEIRKNQIITLDYMMPNFLILNPLTMNEKESLNFNLGFIQGIRTDSGGYTYHYLEKYRNEGKLIPKFYLWATPSKLKDRFANKCEMLFHSIEWSSYYFVEPETFFHIRMGSNWAKHPFYNQMIKEVNLFLDELLSE